MEIKRARKVECGGWFLLTPTSRPTSTIAPLFHGAAPNHIIISLVYQAERNENGNNSNVLA